jgi:hypothetical protein
LIENIYIIFIDEIFKLSLGHKISSILQISQIYFLKNILNIINNFFQGNKQNPGVPINVIEEKTKKLNYMWDFYKISTTTLIKYFNLKFVGDVDKLKIKPYHIAVILYSRLILFFFKFKKKI